MPSYKETSTVYAQCLPSLPSLLLTHGHTEESLWQGTELLDKGWLLQVMPAINPEHQLEAVAMSYILQIGSIPRYFKQKTIYDH